MTIHQQHIDELHEHFVAVWEAIVQRAINAAIRQWRERLLACVIAQGGHFERLNKSGLVAS